MRHFAIDLFSLENLCAKDVSGKCSRWGNHEIHKTHEKLRGRRYWDILTHHPLSCVWCLSWFSFLRLALLESCHNGRDASVTVHMEGNWVRHFAIDLFSLENFCAKDVSGKCSRWGNHEIHEIHEKLRSRR